MRFSLLTESAVAHTSLSDVTVINDVSLYTDISSFSLFSSFRSYSCVQFTAWNPTSVSPLPKNHLFF